MSYFSTALQHVLDAREGVNQASFARGCGIEPATLSRYLSDSMRPDVDGLEKVVSGLKPAERAEIVVGYLEDNVPQSAKDLVRIVNLAGNIRIRDEAPAKSRKLPKAVTADFEFLMDLAEHQPTVVAAIRSTADILRGK